MKFQSALIAGLAVVLQAANGRSNASETPDCVPKCWNNSKYVSSCANDVKCLCEDIDFQGAVFQCLYSQCQTAQFGPALHSALIECSSFHTSGQIELPHLLRQQSLRKRRNTYSESASSALTGHISGYATASAMYSASHRHVSGSGFAYSRTRSVGATHTHTRNHSTFQNPNTMPTTASSTFEMTDVLRQTSTVN